MVRSSKQVNKSLPRALTPCKVLFLTEMSFSSQAAYPITGQLQWLELLLLNNTVTFPVIPFRATG
jgi:hypothetical protein